MDTVKFCALDISTVSTGVAILKYNDYFKKIEIIDKTSLVIKKKQYYDKVKDRKILHPFNKQASMIKLFDYYIKDKIDDISFFVLENYSYKSLGLIANIAEVVSLFKYYLFQNRKYYDTISPSEVKKIITLSGNSRKDKVQKKYMILF